MGLRGPSCQTYHPQDLVSAACPVSAGLIAGFQEEQAGLQEALGHKDSSEQALAEELESQREQLQQVSQQVVALQDENSALRRQKEAVVAEAQDKEASETPAL